MKGKLALFGAVLFGASTTVSLAVAQQGPDGADGETDAVEEAAPAPRLGWNLPLPERQEGQPLTELDRLSGSVSGVSFGADIYDAKSDNPLEPVSVTLRALDKITATYEDLVIPIAEEAAFGTLTLVPRTCDKRPPEETPETTVFLEVFASEEDVQGARTRAARAEALELTAMNEVGQTAPADEIVATVDDGGETSDDDSQPALFRGWMFASSPSLNALEHPVYDVWVIDCKMVDPRI